MQSTLQQMSTQANDTKLLRGIVVNSGEGKLPSSIYNRIARYQGQTKKKCHKNNSNKCKGIILSKLAASRRLADYKK